MSKIVGMGPGRAEPTRVAGCDLGKATARLVVGHLESGRLVVDAAEVAAHAGAPLDVFRRWYRDHHLSSCAAVGVTGVHAAELDAPLLAGLPEDACLEAFLRLRPDLGAPLTLVSVGARGYSALGLDERGRPQHLAGDKCSSGTGETLVKMAGRFGLAVDEADRVAAGAAQALPITARCSVFAKSEMTHFANQGRPADQLLRGYLDSIARYVVSLARRVHTGGPMLLVGGCARLATLVELMRQHAGGELRALDDGMLVEAMGAAQLAGEQALVEAPPPLPRDPDALVRPCRKALAVLPPARRAADRVVRLAARPVAEEAADGPCVLGLDLGSTGSKAVLVSLASGEPVLDVYDRTRGNPVDATLRLVASLLARRAPDVRAVGVTGSGREAVAAVLRAAFPERLGQIVVLNEIVAHAEAAIRCDPDRGRSLSIVEIGGQDAKFVQVARGQIVESDMNKACSAGTGSFLEEQALLYGITEIEGFTALAQQAERPPDLGQMCTVFVAEAAAQAHNEGFSLADILAGFEYAVVHNYIHRVMGSRTFGERVFFQGKPATSPSLGWALAEVTGREVLVPPNPGAMGAWGIGLCAIADLGAATLSSAAPLDLQRILATSVAARAEIVCRDPRCATYCRIERTTVSVAGEERVVLSGGACPKYETAAAGRAKLPVDAPSAFDEREALLAPYLEDAPPEPGLPTVGLPLFGALHQLLPWAVTFLRDLGLGVRVLRPDKGSLARGEERCCTYDACAPVKVAHGVADTDIDLLFFPKFVNLPDRQGPGGTTCPMEQALPEMVEEALRARGRAPRLVHPAFELRDGFDGASVLPQLRRAAQELGASRSRVFLAAQKAAAEQRAFYGRLDEIGARTLEHGRSRGIPVIVLCGPLHVLFDPVVSAGIPGILRGAGVLALPMDCFPVPDDTPRLGQVGWADSARALRTAIACRRRGDAYPLLLSSFGCAPASFTEHFFTALLEGHPHTTLESDGHGGAAGYVTRVQAFLHAVGQHDRRPSDAPTGRVRPLDGPKPRPVSEERGARLVILPFADRAARIIAAAYRSAGLEATNTEPNSPEALAAGRRDCSGKECLPYQLIWGSFRNHLEAQPPDRRTILVHMFGSGACRNCMFSLKDEITLDRLSLGDRVVSRNMQPDKETSVGLVLRLWAAIVAWDILHQLACYYRAVERFPGEVDGIYAMLAEAVEKVIEKPFGGPLGGVVDQGLAWRALANLVEEGAEAMAPLLAASRARDLRTVLVSGDIYLRLDEFAGDSLVRRLNQRRLRVLMEPLGVFAEFMVEVCSTNILGVPVNVLKNTVFRSTLGTIRRKLYERARKHHPWLPSPEPQQLVERSLEVIERYPIGEAPVTVGSVLHTWDAAECDGVIIVAPWGCCPALVSESLLRHRREIPLLFLYGDGTPIADAKLDGLAFRLRRSPSRVAAPPEVEA